MSYEIKQSDKFKYLEVGEGEVIILLHGLFGALSNYVDQIEHYKSTHKVVVPLLPIYELSVFEASLGGLTRYTDEFINHMGYSNFVMLGNSLGGHIGALYTLKFQHKVKGLILTGSSGLFESALGTSFPKRGDYEFIKDRTEKTFYDPKVATKELVDEVFEIVNNRIKAVKIIATAKSAIRHNLRDDLEQIKIPTLLIWGKEDTITPAFVGEEFQRLIPGSVLHIIDFCGHAPMMEKPKEFNHLLDQFIASL
jgi:2-hydroxy-6-oxonona-2,4-dienedioate hydrolase